ncbi:MAG: lipoate--protein ligase [Bacteriovoracaceae bacterium]
MKIFVYELRCVNPYWNLAFEEHLFQNLDPNGYYLLQWISAPCVVMGRFQNPWTECSLKAMIKDQVLLVRRYSGGGAVYHDLGNANYSFLSPKNHFNKNFHNEILEKTLMKFAIPGIRFGERGDIFTNENKISGCAYRQIKERNYHHGTMLINSDLELLYEYLNFKAKTTKIESNAVASRRNSVINLIELNNKLNVDLWQTTLAETFCEYFLAKDPKTQIQNRVVNDEPDFSKHLEISKIYDELSSSDWIYGQTPKFKYVDETLGTIEVEKGRIVTIEKCDTLKAQKLIGEKFTIT